MKRLSAKQAELFRGKSRLVRRLYPKAAVLKMRRDRLVDIVGWPVRVR